MRSGAIWILGATGRIGRAVAARFVADGLSPVLVGRDATRLSAVAERLNGRATIEMAPSLTAMIDAVVARRPAVVVNTIGPFVRTAVPIAQACPAGTHYVDLSNELPSVLALLALHDHAVSRGSVFVTGAGFGVLATESVVLTLCEDRPPAARVRCAAIPAVNSEPGPIGEAFAASIGEAFAYGGRRYEAGRLVTAPLLGDFERVALPDGSTVGTASGPTGELEAARRASGAPSAVSANSMVPSSPVLRAALRPLMSVMKIGPVRRFAIRRIAAIDVKPVAAKAPPTSWSHARVEWPSGEERQGWMRTGDAMTFTVEVVAYVAKRLAVGEAVPGAYTPGALFGPDLAIECGGQITIKPNQP